MAPVRQTQVFHFDPVAQLVVIAPTQGALGLLPNGPT